MFKKKNYIFLQVQDKVTGDDEEKGLKNEVFSFIDKSIKSFFRKRKIEYVDYYSSPKSLNTYTLMTTFEPRGNVKFLAWVHELYAFSITADERIFRDYNYEKKQFQNGERTITVYKFKI